MPRRRPEPERRFEVYRRGGHSPEAALSLVLTFYGLSQNLVRVKSDGSKEPVAARWTLDEICRLQSLRERWQRGDIPG